MLSMYMAWPRDPAMTDHQRDGFLRDAAVGYMFASKDLVAATLTWLVYMLCTHPHVEAKILDELKSLRSNASALQFRRLHWKFCDSERLDLPRCGGRVVRIKWDLHGWLFAPDAQQQS